MKLAQMKISHFGVVRPKQLNLGGALIASLHQAYSESGPSVPRLGLREEKRLASRWGQPRKGWKQRCRSCARTGTLAIVRYGRSPHLRALKVPHVHRLAPSGE